MLRVMDDGRPLGWAANWGMGFLLVAAALGASAVRGPAQAPTPTDGGTPPVAELPPFDLSYISPSACGFVAIRPAALLSRPEMRPVVERWQRLFKAACREEGLNLDIPLDAIEQVIGPVELKHYPEAPLGERHAILMGPALVRMNRDFDWAAALKALAPQVQVTEVKPGVFECRGAAIAPYAVTFHVTDRRTIVVPMEPGSAVNRHDTNADRWGAAWKQVERTGLALVFDNRHGHWTTSLADDADIASLLAALGRPAHVALGLHWGEQVAVTCAADYTDEPANTDPTADPEAVRRTLRDELARQPKPAGAANTMLYALADGFLKSATVRRDGKLVTAEARLGMKWLDVLQALTPADGEAGKVKVEVREGKP
jgi:hypothetical protein